MQIFIARDGRQLGPYTIAEIQGQVAAGTLQPTDFAWYEGLGDWIPLAQVPGYEPPAPAVHPAFSPGPPPYRSKRPIWATVISIYLFVTTPLGLLSLLLLPLLATLPTPTGEPNHIAQTFTYLDFGFSVAMSLLNLAGAILLFLMRRPAVYFFGAAFGLTILNDVRLMFFKNWAQSGASAAQAFGATIGMSAGIAFGLMLMGAIFFYVLHLYRSGQLR